jgi:hypothetical protein
MGCKRPSVQPRYSPLFLGSFKVPKGAFLLVSRKNQSEMRKIRLHKGPKKDPGMLFEYSVTYFCFFQKAH